MEKKKKKRRTKNKKIRKMNSKIIVIGILLFIAIVLVIILTAHSVTSSVKSTFYIDDMIKVDNQTKNLDIQANIVRDSDSLVMLISSDASDTRMVKVSAEFFNDEGDSIYTDQVSNFVMADGHLLMNIILPNLDADDYAGDIVLKITDDDANDDDFIDASNITYEESHEITEDNSTVFEITGTNNNDSVISHLEGSFVALENNDIVAFDNFNLESVDSNSTFSTTVSLSGILSDDEIVPLDYDDILIFTSAAYSA